MLPVGPLKRSHRLKDIKFGGGGKGGLAAPGRFFARARKGKTLALGQKKRRIHSLKTIFPKKEIARKGGEMCSLSEEIYDSLRSTSRIERGKQEDENLLSLHRPPS